MFNNLSLPIVILSSPRTGSTALYNDLRQIFAGTAPNVLCLNEPVVRVPTKVESVLFAGMPRARGDKIYDEFEFNSLISSNHFILKVHTVNALQYYPDLFKDRLQNGDFYIIRIRRRNVLAQCISAYVSLSLRAWGTSEQHNLVLEKTAVLVNYSKIHYAISFIIRHNRMSNEFVGKINLDVVYEDYPFLTELTVKNTKISNYEEVEQAVIKIMNILRIKQWNEY